jgi:putative transposase
VKYAFIKAHRHEHKACTLCRVIGVHRSGFYAWCRQPYCRRARRDVRQTGLVKQFWIESGGIYGYRKIHDDMKEVGESCGKHRVYRLMRRENLRSQTGYGKRRPKHKTGKPSIFAPNRLEQQFDVDRPNSVWVTDITFIRTYEGWLYLAVVLDLFSRQIVGWSMSSRMQADLVLQALLMAVWRRRPKQEVVVHSDQGTQYTSGDWRAFLRDHRLVSSMSRRGNCYDNAVAESFFQLLKRERIKRRIYTSREAARRDVFDYIELFYNPKRRHGNNGNVSPIRYEKSYNLNQQRV